MKLSFQFKHLTCAVCNGSVNSKRALSPFLLTPINPTSLKFTIYSYLFMFSFHRKHLVLPYAPEDPHGEDFSKETMNIMDAILSRIGLDDDGLGPN